ncbi:alpha/beta hydrolase-fold protein [Streptomyces sp. NBC_00690]|uniref:alpha/beta hydrolase-fold protein n=1 Tax=Streptomyces sp. NBC_00690 TaxID=2975808 RepID=UPI002E2A2499|nr:alpha/beta hydrolase-fold protein [Streptomyces sp. NBC_00690]
MTTDAPALATQLLDAVAAGHHGAVEALTDALHKAGGPLCDPLPDGGYLVTFVWIGPAEQVSVTSQLTFDKVGRAAQMERIAGTDIWYLSFPVADDRLSVLYAFAVDDPNSQVPTAEVMKVIQEAGGMLEFALQRDRCAHHDPFNPDLVTADSIHMGPEFNQNAKEAVLTLPGAASETWFGPSRSPGTLTEHQVRSEVFGDERTITVYTPVGYERGRGDYPLVFLLDGEYQVENYPVILDNLIEAGAIPPSVAAFVHNKDPMSRMVEMCCNPDLATQYADELVPWLRSEYGAGEDPSRTVVTGASYGGLGSAWLAHCRPDVIGRVLSLSGSHWWGQKRGFGGDDSEHSMGHDSEPEWLTRQIAADPVTPTRYWVSAGTLEVQPLPFGITLLAANRHLRDVLIAKGYEVQFDEFPGAHEHAGWRRSFANGLRYLLGDLVTGDTTTA